MTWDETRCNFSRKAKLYTKAQCTWREVVFKHKHIPNPSSIVPGAFALPKVQLRSEWGSTDRPPR